MKQRPTDVTPEEAKAVWDGMDSPTSTRVARAFSNAGRKIDGNTISRWRKNGWALQKSGVPTEAVAALDDLDVGVTVLTMDPNKRLENLIPPLPTETPHQRRMRDLRRDLEGSSDEAVLRDSSRQLLIIGNLVLKEAEHQAAKLIKNNPKEFGSLLESASRCVAAGMDGMDRLVMLRERSMKLISDNKPGSQEVLPPQSKPELPPRPIEDDPLFNSLIKFGLRPDKVPT